MSQPEFPTSRTEPISTLLQAGVSMIPVLGGPLDHLLDAAVLRGLRRRRQIWLNSLAELVNDLAAQTVDLDMLADDERFLSAVVRATRVADSTHLEGKLNHLRAALRNVATSRLPWDDELVDRLFFNALDDLDPVHIEALRAMDDPLEFLRRHAKTADDLPAPSAVHSMGQLLDTAGFLLNPGNREIVFADLSRFGLLSLSPFSAVTHLALSSRQTTDRGRDFLRFIADL